LRKTSAKKLRNKLAELKKTMRERLHWSIPDLGKWLKSVIIGHWGVRPILRLKVGKMLPKEMGPKLFPTIA
jgi:hypothetical protein